MPSAAHQAVEPQDFHLKIEPFAPLFLGTVADISAGRITRLPKAQKTELLELFEETYGAEPEKIDRTLQRLMFHVFTHLDYQSEMFRFENTLKGEKVFKISEADYGLSYAGLMPRLRELLEPEASPHQRAVAAVVTVLLGRSLQFSDHRWEPVDKLFKQGCEVLEFELRTHPKVVEPIIEALPPTIAWLSAIEAAEYIENREDTYAISNNLLVGAEAVVALHAMIQRLGDKAPGFLKKFAHDVGTEAYWLKAVDTILLHFLDSDRQRNVPDDDYEMVRDAFRAAGKAGKAAVLAFKKWPTVMASYGWVAEEIGKKLSKDCGI